MAANERRLTQIRREEREKAEVKMGDAEINALTEKIIGCAYAVGNQLGAGFLEKVYENAMVIELEKQGLAVEQRKR